MTTSAVSSKTPLNPLILKVCEDKMREFAPTAEDLAEWFRDHDEDPGPLITDESECRSWRDLLERATHDAPCLK
jgi:hypothetical protein